MQPVVSSDASTMRQVLVRDIDAIRQTVDCPISFSPMSHAVSLYPCGHTLEEESAIRLGSRNISVNPPDRAVNDPRLPRCPLDRRPVLGYIPSLVTRDVVNQFERVFDRDAPPEDMEPRLDQAQAAARVVAAERAMEAVRAEALAARTQAERSTAAERLARAEVAAITTKSLKERIAVVASLVIGTIGSTAAAFFLTPGVDKPINLIYRMRGYLPEIDYANRDQNTQIALLSAFGTAMAVVSTLFFVNICRRH